MARFSSVWEWNMGCPTLLIIESKVFTLALEGHFLHVTERSRRLMEVISLGTYMIPWLAKALEAWLRGESIDFYSAQQEGDRFYTKKFQSSWSLHGNSRIQGLVDETSFSFQRRETDRDGGWQD